MILAERRQQYRDFDSRAERYSMATETRVSPLSRAA